LSHRLSLLVAVPFLVAGLVACGGNSVLTADTVAASAADALEQQVGVRPSVTCPDDVEAAVGAKTRCTLTGSDDPTQYGVTVTVTSVDGKNATFDVTVDDQPLG
jgi:hypothetical protein